MKVKENFKNSTGNIYTRMYFVPLIKKMQQAEDLSYSFDAYLSMARETANKVISENTKTPEYLAKFFDCTLKAGENEVSDDNLVGFIKGVAAQQFGDLLQPGIPAENIQTIHYIRIANIFTAAVQNEKGREFLLNIYHDYDNEISKAIKKGVEKQLLSFKNATVQDSRKKAAVSQRNREDVSSKTSSPPQSPQKKEVRRNKYLTTKPKESCCNVM